MKTQTRTAASLTPPDPGAGAMPPRGAGRAAVLLTCVVMLVFAVFVRVYEAGAGPRLKPLGDSLGDVLMEQGIQFEDGGENANAVQAYTQALECRFDSPQNRAYTLKRLGSLLVWTVGPEQGLPYLRQAFEDPDCPLNTYDVLCSALLMLERYDEVFAVTARWIEQARRTPGCEQQEALALYREGKALQGLGRKEEALERFVRGNTVSAGGLNAYEAGVHYYDTGDDERALQYLELYLQGGAGGRVEYAQALRRKLLEKRAPSASPGASP